MVTLTQNYILGALASLVVIAIAVTYNYKSNKNIQKQKDDIKEGFTADGYYVIPPNWFHKQTYDPRQWLVRQYVDTIQPECMSYSKASKYGSLDNLNYMASATRFWRM